MTLLAIILYALIGACSGLLSGLLGISGGLVTVPSLYFLFQFLGLPQLGMHMAIGTSLASMVFSAISATWAHARNKEVRWRIFRAMLTGVVIGSVLGAILAVLLPGMVLERFFGIFAIVLGAHFMHPFLPYSRKSKELPNHHILNGYGLGIGAISNILGIGGGIFTVPVLLYYRLPDRQAIGTSAAVGIIVTLIGAISYLIAGAQTTHYPHTLGYLYIPAFLIISVTSLFTAPYGAYLTQRLSPLMIRKAFGLVLCLTGISMLIF